MSGEAWNSLANLCVVVYAPEREAEVNDVYGPVCRPALVRTGDAKTGRKINIGIPTALTFLAWFAKGSSHVALQEYADAANAYDQALQSNNSIGEDDKQRPYRMMWYQTGPSGHISRRSLSRCGQPCQCHAHRDDLNRPWRKASIGAVRQSICLGIHKLQSMIIVKHFATPQLASGSAGSPGLGYNSKFAYQSTSHSLVKSPCD